MKIIAFFNVSALERRLFLEALLFIAYARIAIKFYSFKKLMTHLGEPQKESPIKVLTPEQQDFYQKIGIAINRAAKIAFWRTKCYEKAVTAKLMLRRRNIPTTIYIGMMKDDDKGMEGHAWIRSGNYIITGNHELEKYVIVGVFS